MKRAINVAIWVACISLAISIFMLILLCAGLFGRSAFQIATKNGFLGTEQEWLDSLKGANGKSAYELYVESLPQDDTALSEEQWLAGLAGQRGASWFSGVDAPDVEDARQGDFYLRVFNDFTDRRGYMIYMLSGDEWIVIADMSTDAPQQTVTEYNVRNVYDLKTFRDTVNAGNSYANKTIKLAADINLKGENWTPIGTSDNKFQGTFDGDNHTVSNLTCNVDDDYVGLFGVSSGATFRNVTIDGATLNGSGYIGALLGSSFPSGRIENVTAKNVTATGNHYIGGVFGAGYVTIEDCKAYDVTATAAPNVIEGDVYDNGDKIGGIAGQIREYDTIHNCEVDGITLTGYRDIGGVAGYAYSSPSTHSAKNVKVIVDQTNFYEYKATNVGAIFGYTTKPEQSGTVENATYTLANVVATKSQEFVNLLTLVNQLKPTKANITLTEGTFEASANEQFRLNVDNVTVNGRGEDVTIVDAKGFTCSGQASFEVCGDNCTVSNLTITAEPQNGNVAVLKVTEINNEDDIVNNFTLSHVTLDNTSESNVGHGLNLHGVNSATVDYLSVTNYGKCGIALAKATDVTITNTDLTDGDNTNWANIGFMYSESSVDAYKTHSDVTVDFDSCTFGKNSSGQTLIYSERPAASHDDKADVISDTTLGVLTADNLPANWKLDVNDNGMWSLTKVQSSSGSELQLN